MSETAAAGTVVDWTDRSFDTCGTLKAPNTEIRIRSIPELNYDVNNEESLGEVEISGDVVFSGYWNSEQKNLSLFTKDGFFRTGDVGSIRNNKLVIVERMSSTFKSTHGEMISADMLEAAYSESKYVDDIVVTAGDAKLVAVVLLCPDLLSRVNDDREGLYIDVLKDLDSIASKKQFCSYERIGAIHVETTEWSQGDGFLSASMKKKRKVLLRHYESEIEELVVSMKQKLNTFSFSCRTEV
ncbi:hypothetical protein GEMRC1_012726 [Eukaryota sp. GEM-RC1]